MKTPCSERPLVDNDEIELQVFSDAHVGAHRSRRESWQQLPQAMRAITLGELWALYKEHKDWLEELRWRCSACHLSASGRTGPCGYCGCKDGRLQMRNLHEVVATIITPACEITQTSYVELLTRSRRLQDQRCGVPVETFVSHWWGEEFPKLIQTLDRYAAVRCASSRNMKLVYATFVLSISVVCVVQRFYVVASSDTHDNTWYYSPPLLCEHLTETISLISGWDLEQDTFSSIGKDFTECASWSLTLVPMVLLATATAAICIRHKQRDPMTWGFWICAFANNQFEISHALAQDSDVLTSAFAVALLSDSCTSVVAVLDKSGQIYQRIWCCFELFFVTVVLRSKFNRHLDLSLANQFGVLSMGDGTREQLNYLQAVIANVKTATAKATVEDDARIIGRALQDEQTTYEQLDLVLRDLAMSGVRAVKRRAVAPLIISLLLPIVWLALHCMLECGLFAFMWQITYFIEPDDSLSTVSLTQARRTIWWFMVFITAFNILLWSARGFGTTACCTLGSWKQEGGFMVKNKGRFIELVVVPFLPILVAELVHSVLLFLSFLHVNKKLRLWLYFLSMEALDVLGSFLLVHYVLCIIICSFGVSYYFALRDRHALSWLRQSLEDLLYNA